MFKGRVGFIGLGGMGRGVVKNMLLKGIEVHVFDVNPEAVEGSTTKRYQGFKSKIAKS